MRSDIIELELFLHFETAKAWAISEEGDKRNLEFLPKSLVEVDAEPGKFCMFLVPEHVAHEKGLI